MRDVAGLEATVTAHRELAAGVLRIGTLPTLAATVAAGVIATFRRRHPGVAVQIADAVRDEISGSQTRIIRHCCLLYALIMSAEIIHMMIKLRMLVALTIMPASRVS